MKKKLYIFDLDGTILDTLKDLAISVNYALAVFDFPSLSTKKLQTEQATECNGSLS